MSTTAQQLIEAAYARSTASDAGKLAVDGEMLAHLNRKYQSTYARWALRAGDAALVKTTLTWSGSPASVTLPTDIVDIELIQTNAGGRTSLIAVRDKDRVNWHLPPAFFRVGNTLVSRGLSGDPIAADVYQHWYKDAPVTLSALSTALDARYPVRFESLLIIDLALYLSAKDENRSAQKMQEIRDELTREEKAFAEIVGENASAKVTAGTEK